MGLQDPADVPMSPMRWFTRQLATGELTDIDEAEAFAEFARHNNMLAKRVPANLRPFIEQNDNHLRVDDARFETVRIDPFHRIVELSVIQGELSYGYGLLTATFSGAELLDLTPAELQTLLATPKLEVWYFEFDEVVEPPAGRFEVRFLLWPRGEFGVRFEQATWTWRRRKGRKYHRRPTVLSLQS